MYVLPTRVGTGMADPGLRYTCTGCSAEQHPKPKTTKKLNSVQNSSLKINYDVIKVIILSFFIYFIAIPT